MEVKNKQYEIMLVLKPTLLESAVEKKLKEFDGFLAEEGGEVSLKDIWGKQKLAYRIKGFDEGNYVAYNLTLPGSAVREVNEHIRLDVDVLRHLLVTLNEGSTYSKYDKVLEAPKKKREPMPTEKGLPTEYKSGKQAKTDSPGGAEEKDEKKGAKVDDKLDEKLSQILSDDKLDF